MEVALAVFKYCMTEVPKLHFWLSFCPCLTYSTALDVKKFYVLVHTISAAEELAIFKSVSMLRADSPIFHSLNSCSR
jgi:hypothetical protein